MTRLNLKALNFSILFFGIMGLTACKNKDKTKEPTTVDSTKTISTPPIETAPDDALQAGVKDATKDFPGVNATVSNGEITLTGDITRDRLPKLMMALSSLHAKKINNNLTVK